MSLREDIALDVIKSLTEFRSQNTNLNSVYRAPKAIEDLARTAFPTAIVTTADEERTDITMGGSAIRRQGIITYWIDVHVWGEQRDQALNELIDTVEDALDADRTRGGVAKDTTINTVRLLEPTSAKPWTTVRIFVDVQYDYIRGSN